MPFDSNGTFNREIPGGWKADALAGIKIRADRHDTEDDGFATGLSTCITKDGRTQPTANIPMNNKKLTNLGEPDNPNDAATKNYVDNFKSFSTGATIAGAGPINGFIHFSSPVGINGIGWETADMSWVGKLEEAGKTSKRLCVNDKKDGTGTDVCTVDETGRLNIGNDISSNCSYEAGVWRTISPGFVSLLSMHSGGFHFHANDTATTVAYQNSAFRNFYEINNAAGQPTVYMHTSGSGKGAQILATNNGSTRWHLQIMNGTPETGGNVGNDFAIHRYNDGGGIVDTPFSINRASGGVNMAQNLNVGGQINCSQNIQSNGVNAVLASAGGGIYLRPHGAGNATNQSIFDAAGNFSTGSIFAAGGYRCRAGTSGGFGANQFNIFWQSPYVYVYIDNTNMGAIYWQSDYRFKKGIKALGSMWDKVKSLRPIKYSIKKWNMFEADNTERWGFVAHEMQEKLHPAAATGSKDEDNVVQQIDPVSLTAALTKALQEAMERIEALEARLA